MPLFHRHVQSKACRGPRRKHWWYRNSFPHSFVGLYVAHSRRLHISSHRPSRDLFGLFTTNKAVNCCFDIFSSDIKELISWYNYTGILTVSYFGLIFCIISIFESTTLTYDNRKCAHIWIASTIRCTTSNRGWLTNYKTSTRRGTACYLHARLKVFCCRLRPWDWICSSCDIHWTNQQGRFYKSSLRKELASL